MPPGKITAYESEPSKPTPRVEMFAKLRMNEDGALSHTEETVGWQNISSTARGPELTRPRQRLIRLLPISTSLAGSRDIRGPGALQDILRLLGPVRIVAVDGQ